MNVSARTEYACLAVLELASRHDSGEPLRVRAIAEAHGIPSRFLVQILHQLKGAGVVTSVRGAAGGYRLVQNPAEISLADIMQVIEAQGDSIHRNCSRDTAFVHVLLNRWNETARLQREMLAAVTFQDLLDDAAQVTEHQMYYI